MKHAARSAIGAALGVLGAAISGLALARLTGQGALVIPPIGASAVLVFAVTASPLAQPRAVIGGNLVAITVGLAIAALVPVPLVAIVFAVALAIAAMLALDCLHPPSGAVALLPALAGPAVLAHGGMAIVALVVANSLALVLAGWSFHRLTGHSYPHRSPVLPEMKPGWRGPDPGKVIHLDADRADILAVLDELEDVPDISLEDLAAIVQAVEVRRAARA